MKLAFNNFLCLFAIIIIGSQLLFVSAESSTVNTDSNSLDLNKRYRFDKKDLTTSIDSSESNDLNDDSGYSALLNKRYRFDKRYRYDKKRSDFDGINKRYRFDKRYRYD